MSDTADDCERDMALALLMAMLGAGDPKVLREASARSRYDGKKR